jgi:hypothetical protein
MYLHKHLTFFEASLLYIFAGVILTRVLNISEILKSFFALPVFFLLPLLFGMILVNFGKMLFRSEMQDAIISEVTGYFVFCLLIGIFSIEFIAVMFQILKLSLLLKNIGYLILAMVTSSFLYSKLSSHKIPFGQCLEASIKRHFALLLLIFGFNIAPFLLKISLVQPPLPTWDSWANPIPHVQAVLRLLNTGFFDITQRWVDILFSAMSCQLFNVSQPEFFSYVGTLLVTAIFSLGTYTLAYKFSSNVIISLLSGVVSIFLNFPKGFHEVPAYHFKANTILISLGPWVVLLIIDLLERAKNLSLKNSFVLTAHIVLFFASLAILASSVGISTLYSSGITYETQYTVIRPVVMISVPMAILFIYSFSKKKEIGFLATLFLACTVLYTIHESDSLIYISLIVFQVFIFYLLSKKGVGTMFRLFSLVIFLLALLGWNNIISIPDILVSANLGYETYPLNSFLVKKIVFSDGNALITRYFFILGLVVLIFSRSEKDLFALGILTTIFSIYFFPDYWTARALGATTPFLAYAISKDLDLVSKIVGSVFTGRKRTKAVIACILASLIVVTIAPNLLNPIYIKFSTFPGSRLAPYEYNVAVWLRDNTRETEVILSDYWTMMLLNPVSNKIWLTDRQFMYSYLDQEYKDLLMKLKDSVFKARNSWEAYSELQALANVMREGLDWTEKYYCNYVGVSCKNITFLIILSSRTVEWLETGNMEIMEPQYSSVNPNYLAIFNDTRYFTLLTQIPGQIYVFRVKS